MRGYYAKNAERMRAQKRAEAARRAPEQRARVAQRSAEWAAANPEAVEAARRKWREANPEAHKAAGEAWRLANLDRVNETGKKWKKNNPEAMRIYHLRKYGLTPETFEAMLVRQGRRCAICRGEFGKKGPCVDHHHDSKRTRGLLCTACNAGLGQMQESHVILLAAIDYLVEHGDIPGILP